MPILYIKIPEGMQHKQLKDEMGDIKDVLVNEHGVKTIALQDIAQNLIQNNHSKSTFNGYHKKGLSIYITPPTTDPSLFLKYEPKNNCSLPADNFSLIKGVDILIKYSPAQSTRYGEFWFQKTVLDPAKLTDIVEKHDEQRLNRQKIGPSPNAN